MCRCDVEKVYKRKAEDRLKEQNNINERERERERESVGREDA